MNLLSAMEHPAAGNVVVLIAAIVGVVGSYLLYRKRIQDRRKALRIALKAEIRGNDKMIELAESWSEDGYDGRNKKIPKEEIPPSGHLATKVYDGNIDKIGRLKPEEIEKLTEFYRAVEYLNSLTELLRENGKKASRSAHEAYISAMLRYGRMREDLVKMLEGEIEPSSVEAPQAIRKLEGGIKLDEEEKQENESTAKDI